MLKEKYRSKKVKCLERNLRHSWTRQVHLEFQRQESQSKLKQAPRWNRGRYEENDMLSEFDKYMIETKKRAPVPDYPRRFLGAR